MGQKGGAFEREVANKLSLWATGEPDESIFWRSPTSGARATVRSRKGKKTAGQHSDISATDIRGVFLTELVTIEAKRGYSTSTASDLIDRPPSLKGLTCLEQFYEQVKLAQKSSGVPYWMIVARRNKRLTTCYFSNYFLSYLESYGLFRDGLSIPSMQLCVRMRKGTSKKEVTVRIVCMLFDDWLEEVPAKMLRKIHKDHMKGKNR